jgi:hypothetical protein
VLDDRLNYTFIDYYLLQEKNEAQLQKILQHELIHAYTSWIRVLEYHRILPEIFEQTPQGYSPMNASKNLDDEDAKRNTLYGKLHAVITDEKLQEYYLQVSNRDNSFRNRYMYRPTSNSLYSGGFPFHEIETTIGEAFAPDQTKRLQQLADVVIGMQNRMMIAVLELFIEYGIVPNDAFERLEFAYRQESA